MSLTARTAEEVASNRDVFLPRYFLMTLRAGRYLSEVTIGAYGRSNRPGNMATVQTWLTRWPRDLFHDHMLFVPVIT